MGFSDESNGMFDELADFMRSQRSKGYGASLHDLRYTDIAMKIKNGKIKPSKRNWINFFNYMGEVKFLPETRKFVKNVHAGKYNKEFGKLYGPHSRTSEVFSLFAQAILYDKGMSKNPENKKFYVEELKYADPGSGHGGPKAKGVIADIRIDGDLKEITYWTDVSERYNWITEIYHGYGKGSRGFT